jgi:hypothetical protein
MTDKLRQALKLINRTLKRAQIRGLENGVIACSHCGKLVPRDPQGYPRFGQTNLNTGNYHCSQFCARADGRRQP